MRKRFVAVVVLESGHRTPLERVCDSGWMSRQKEEPVLRSAPLTTLIVTGTPRNRLHEGGIGVDLYLLSTGGFDLGISAGVEYTYLTFHSLWKNVGGLTDQTSDATYNYVYVPIALVGRIPSILPSLSGSAQAPSSARSSTAQRTSSTIRSWAVRSPTAPRHSIPATRSRWSMACTSPRESISISAETSRYPPHCSLTWD